MEDFATHLFVLSLFLFIFGAFGALCFSRHAKLANVLAHCSSFLGGLVGATTAVLVLSTKQSIVVTAWVIMSDVVLRFKIDMLSAYFLFVVSLVTVAVSLYSLGYVTEYYGKKSVGLLGSGLNLFVLSMIAVITVDHSVSFLIAWELMSLLSFFLVMVEHEKAETRKAGYVYVVMTHFGTVFIILSFLILFFFTNQLDFSSFTQMAAHLPASVKNIVFLLSFIGFGTKAGMIPLHVWLPRAHPAAPSHVSALMSAVMIKTAIYGLLRVNYDFLKGGATWWGAVVLGIGILSAVFGILFGVAENDMKRFLAFSSAENIGIIFMGLGASLLFRSYHEPLLGALALTALLYHVLNHAIFKGLLFMGAGSVLYATHTKNINELGGLIRFMPWTAVFFLIGGMSLAAFPPFNGFMSEWATFQSLLHLSFSLHSPIWKTVGGLAAAALGLTGALVAGSVVKQFGTAFLALPRTPHAIKAKEVPLVMRLGMGMLACGVVVFGVWPGLVLRMTNTAAESYFHQSLTGRAMLYVPFHRSGESISLGGIAIIFFAILLLLIAVLRASVGKSNNHYDETWNCGTPLVPSMEYTGTSYSHPVLMIFKRIYGIKRKVDIQGEYTYYPKRIRHRLKTEAIIETKLYRPLIRGTVSLSQRLRTIQNGNLQSYLAYMIITLIVLLLWIR
ncbi:hydrogenase 4 subunit B [Anoxybacteroides amylolyticum]|uniref:NADH-Ubiquinone/plastoquinone (Complex I), various chains family protein n=1 Tax=Anoxybacteroides amylolyticum TaxID=294699 RepID=A0A160F6I9_9BACL|nr:hydrogenase 4 subunit B [Anoxybacillus amylolyticus]ANB61722.1 NADH-Ubiquinone/plastoquinone (complex I), various chains family protein [Anoxybacillus amylolyticus]